MPGFATIIGTPTIVRSIQDTHDGVVVKNLITVLVNFRVGAINERRQFVHEVDAGVPLDAEVRRQILALIGRTVRQWALRKLAEQVAPPVLDAPLPVGEQDADDLAALEP